MRTIRLYKILLYSILAMVSCNNYTNQVYRTPDFPYVTDVNNIKFLTDDICVNTVSDIFKYGEHLYIIAYDAQNQTYLQAYDIKTGERLYSTIRYGNGPGEIIYPNISYFDYDSGHLHFYDKVSERIFEYDLSNQVSLVAENISTNFPWITHYFPIKSLGNLTMMAIKEGASEQLNNARISLINDQNQVVSEYNNFPIESDKNIQYAVYQTDRADISMDKQHLIVGTSYGSILEIFDITEGIMPKAVKYFVEPTLILREGKYNNDDTIIGFNDLFASNQYIYASYDGENYGNVPACDFFNNIAVFDYNGMPVILLRMKNRVERICVDEEAGEIYAVLKLHSGEVKIAKLNMREYL